jgi:hypothetical protein
MPSLNGLYNIWFKASQRWKRRFLALRYVMQHLAFSTRDALPKRNDLKINIMFQSTEE